MSSAILNRVLLRSETSCAHICKNLVQKQPPLQQRCFSSKKIVQDRQHQPLLSTSFSNTLSTRLYSAAIATSFDVKDSDDFDASVITASKNLPIVVDFHAEWCGPCKMLGPTLESEVAKHGGKVMLAKVDVDDCGEIAMKYKVMVVPTVLLVKNGDVINKFEGNAPEEKIQSFIESGL